MIVENLPAWNAHIRSSATLVHNFKLPPRSFVAQPRGRLTYNFGLSLSVVSVDDYGDDYD